MRQWYTLGQCMARVLADSTRTLDIMTAEELLGQAQLPHLLRRGTFDSVEGRAVMADKPDLTATDLEALAALPVGTLGRTFADFLRTQNLDLTMLRQPTPYTADPEVAFVLRRLRASHDLWHTLIGVGTEGHEEVLVHGFSLGQTGMPASIVIITLGSLKHMVLEGRWQVLRRDILRAYHIGRNASPLLGLYWEKRWSQTLLDVRKEHKIQTLY